MAVGLGSVDMPVPSVLEWEWLNWKFPRPVHSGDTIYARWTLTQKRPPVGGAAAAIVVWRVDVHMADGALCAEGEVGAKVRRKAQAGPLAAGPSAAGPSASAPRRRRRRSRANGAVPEAPAVAAPPAQAAKPERAAGPTRRRRRRRAPAAVREDNHAPQTAAAAPVLEPPPPAAPARSRGGLGSVIRRLRRT